MGKGVREIERLGRDSSQHWAMLGNGKPGTLSPRQQEDGSAEGQ